jgi:DNA-binding CsgD family transcriptional regulator
VARKRYVSQTIWNDTKSMTADIIDRIYECALVPELWPDVLKDVSALVDGFGSVLFAVRGRQQLDWTASDKLKGIFQSYVTDGWFDRCTRRVCLFSKSQPTFLTEHDFFSDQELDNNPIYRDFFRPHGLGWSAGTGLPLPSGDSIIFSFEREFNNGPLETDHIAILNGLRPHLARSALISARLGLQTAKGANHALEMMGLPVFILGLGGTVIECNSLVESLTPHIQWRARDKLALNDKHANILLQDCLASIDTQSRSGVLSFPLRDPEGNAVLVAHVVPLKRSANDFFVKSYALLVITPVTARRAPPVELLRSLFDLTPSEARVARSLAAGESLDEIAVSGKVSKNTIRSQLQQVLEKTGCTRQSEVTALLSNIAINPEPTKA